MIFINQEQLIKKFRKKARFHKNAEKNALFPSDHFIHSSTWKAFEEAIKACKELGEDKKASTVEMREILPAHETKIDNNFTNNVKIIIKNQKKTFKLNDKDIAGGDLIFKLLPDLKLCSQRVSASPPYLPDSFVDFCEKELIVIHNGEFVALQFNSELDILNDPPEKVITDFKERIQKIKELQDTKKVIEFDI